jgi:hypothetical protein
MKTLCLFLILLNTPLFSLVNTEVMRKKNMDPGLTHLLASNISSYSGNTDYSLVDLTYRTDFYSPKDQGFLVVNVIQGTESGGRFSNSGFLHLRGIRPINPLFNAEVFVQKEFDEFINLKSRLLFGASMRYSPKDVKENTTWNTGIGAIWEEEVISRDNDKTLVRLSNYFTLRHTLPDAVSFITTSYYQPHLGDFSDYRIQSENKAQFLITAALSFDMTLNLRYDSEPSSGLEKLDTQITNGLTFRFDTVPSMILPRSKLRNESIPVQESSTKNFILVPVPLEDSKAEEEKIIIRSPG